MLFWKKKNWEDEYDEYYAQDRGTNITRPRTKTRYFAHLLMLAFLGGLFLAAVGLISGRTMVEKFASSLVSPLGVIWCALILLVYFSLLNRQAWPAIVGFITWLLLTVSGNYFVSNGLAMWIEAPFQDINPYEGEPYDLVVVLGGGTTTTVTGRSQLALNGDRIAVAAQVYHAGRAKKIVCTGSQTYLNEPDLHPREEATNILIGLSVPKESILQMKGNNTFEEMTNLKAWIAENNIEGRVGVITSAWHLPRTLRLAESNGLSLEPIPANFISETYSANPGIVIPTPDNISITSRILKELLAGWVGR